MIPLIQSRVPAAPPKPVTVVRAWDARCPRTSAIIKNAVVLEHTPNGYAVSGPLLSPDPFAASQPLFAVMRGRAIREAKDLVAAKLIPWAENIMSLANAFAADGDDEDAVKPCPRCSEALLDNARLCPACIEEITADADDTPIQLDRVQVAAAVAERLGDLRAAYADVVPVEGE